MLRSWMKISFPLDSYLSVYGIGKLRIADGSIMPGVTIGNTMVPCVVIGEHAADILKMRPKRKLKQ